MKLRQDASLRLALAPVPFILQCSLPFQSKRPYTGSKGAKNGMLAWLLLFFIRVTNIEGPSCAGQGARSWRMRVTVSVFMASWYSFLLLFDSDHLTGKKKMEEEKIRKKGEARERRVPEDIEVKNDLKRK